MITAALSAGLLAAQAARADTPSAPSGPKVTLKGTVGYTAQQLAVVGAARRPVKFLPFTLAEMAAIAPKDKVRQVGNETQFLVNLKRGPQWVPATTYIQQLNAYEKFVNGYGYTLRDGPLAPLKANSVSRVSPDLGLSFRLKPPPMGTPSRPAPAVNGLAGNGYQLNFTPEEIIGGGVDPTSQAALGARVGWGIMTAPDSRAYHSGISGGRAVFDKASKLNGAALPGGHLAGALPATTTHVQCAKVCTFKLAYDYNLTDAGWAIVLPYGYVNETHEVSGHQYVTSEVPGKDYYADWFPPGQEDDFIANYADICKMKADLGPKLFNQLYKGLTADAGSSDGDVSPPIQGTVAKTFYEGTLDLKIDNISDCFGDGSDNGWFGASLCANYQSANSYNPKTGFDVANTADYDSDVTLFGLRFTLLETSAGIHWQQAPGATKAEPMTPQPSINEATTGANYQSMSQSQTYDGPSAFFFIGPVPINISSALVTNIGLDDPKYTDDTPAIAEPQTGVDKVGVDIGAHAGAAVSFDADVDVLVAKAGVNGTMNLASATADGSIVSSIDTGQNLGSVDKSYTLGANMLSGSVSAFVELDLLVYTKRWSLDIADFDGISTTAPVKTRHYERPAVIPAPEPAPSTCN